jgi:fibronectin type 3 domain-containing protein
LPPATPANLTAKPGNSQVSLGWSAVSRATGYNIYASTSSGHEAAPVALAVSGGTSTGGTVTGLVNGQTYYFLVQAINGAGHSPSSSEVSATPQGLPIAPTKVTATAASNRVNLSWSAVPGASSYNIYMSTSAGHEAPPVALSVSGTSGAVTGLSNGQTYYFVVQAINSYGHSPSSSEVSATPQGVPPAPARVTATAVSGGVTLGWSAVPGASSYNIYKSTSAGHEAPPVALTVSGGASTGGTVSGLARGQAYYFVVQAINSYGHSPSSGEVSARPN